jgi:hypothetical protein
MIFGFNGGTFLFSLLLHDENNIVVAVERQLQNVRFLFISLLFIIDPCTPEKSGKVKSGIES